jgi:hypothetical protein
MSWPVRALVYAVVVLLVMIVYSSQKHANARDSIRAAVPKWLKGLVYTLILVVVMFGLGALFIG